MCVHLHDVYIYIYTSLEGLHTKAASKIDMKAFYICAYTGLKGCIYVCMYVYTGLKGLHFKQGGKIDVNASFVAK